MQKGKQTIQAALRQNVIDGADAERIADLSVSVWQEVHAALTPIVGESGVAALYKRSLYIAKAHHPALAVVYEGDLRPGEFSSLRQSLARQSGADAATVSGALLRTFESLLATLIGASLGERLLRSALDGAGIGTADRIDLSTGTNDHQDSSR